MKKLWPLFINTVILFIISQAFAKDNLQLRINRWLEVRSISGNVSYANAQTSQPARVGTRLKNVGESISTGKNSRTVLALDTGIGFINVAENTQLRIQQLKKTSSGGSITDLQVLTGQVKLKLRRFTNQSSHLRIETPAGITGVRGTEFGVSVQPSGKTGIATLTGSVATTAQGQSVNVNKGFQSLVIPGEAPTPPVPLRDDTKLDLLGIKDIGNGEAQIVGKVDPVNLVILTNRPLNTDRNGNFDLKVPIPSDRLISVSVTTPLGKQKNYRLAVP
ncbi:MAG TPA: FecR family protein [Nostocaceae cyanobacterium]|nr:FecR family protein [Nostocaceae cyanobacterium]